MDRLAGNDPETFAGREAVAAEETPIEGLRGVGEGKASGKGGIAGSVRYLKQDLRPRTAFGRTKLCGQSF